MLPETKLLDLRNRTTDPQAVPCLIPVIGTSELNHLMWTNWKKQLATGCCKFLVDEQEAQGLLEDSGEFYQLSSEGFADRMIPFIETTSLIYEAINLKSIWKKDILKLEEPRSGTKDKAVVASYGNYIISQLELQWAKIEQEEDLDIDDIQLVW